MTEKNNIKHLEIGDYVYDMAGAESLSGVVVSFSGDGYYWVNILNLKSLELTEAVHASRLYQDKVPKKYEALYNLLKISDFSLNLADYFKPTIIAEGEPGKESFINPIMDELRSQYCMCITCESDQDESCETAQQLYEIEAQNGVSVAITRCRKYKGINR